jgi:hypothetical protein
MNRPKTYTIAAILMLLYSLINIISEIPPLALGAPDPGADAPPFAVTVLSFALAILGVVAAYGVWRMQKWGVVLTIVVAALGILTSLPAIIFAPVPMRFLAGLGVVWSAAIIVLLLRPAPTTATA